MASYIRRRKFLATLGGAATWPLAARAQQPERMRRIGVLLPYAADDREGQVRLAAFQQALAELGWSDSGNVRIETRWGAGDPDRYRQYAAELVALAPDVVVAVTTAVAAALQRETRQHHRFYHFRIRDQPEMAGAAQGDRAPRDARQQSFGIPPWPSSTACSAESSPWRPLCGWS
jgi:hypothetical protein